MADSLRLSKPLVASASPLSFASSSTFSPDSPIDMQIPHSLFLLISLFASSQLAQGLPTPHRQQARDVTITHKSLLTGNTTSHTIDAALLPEELAKAIDGSDVNINLTTDRVKRSPSPASGIKNSTINLTVIGSRKRSAESAQHHNIHIDASSSGRGGQGGIHNSTFNINLNSASKRNTRRKVALGDHSVLVDVSTVGTDAQHGGIEDSTVHVNILPPRALNKSTGHHSIVVDSSSLSSDAAAHSTTTTGDHSAVVDTSSSSSSGTSSSGVKNSTINLTVISPKDEPVASAEPVSASADTVDSPLPSLARLSKRSTPAFEAWSSSIQRKDLSTDSQIVTSPEVPAAVAAAAEQSGFVVVRRNHSSKPAVLVKRA
ncbi:hypothetical protein JCM11641_001058 [Rhodosporidiobolus odoratus]